MARCSLFNVLLATLALILLRIPGMAGDTASRGIKDKYLALTRGWAREAVFTEPENRAMQEGRRRERLMTNSLDDSLAGKLLKDGEPSFDSVASFYPGKILDRTVLGSYSDPRSNEIGPSDEFVIWWNGAISANLIKAPFPNNPQRLQPQAENTNILFRVGPSAEMFGKIGDRFTRIGYEGGYLPIVQAAYECDGVRYTETAFADNPKSETPGWDIAYVRFELKNVSKATRTAKVSEDVILIDGSRVAVSGRKVLDPSGAVLIAFSGSAAFDSRRQRLTHQIFLAPGDSASVFFKIPYVPDSGHRVKAATPEDFQNEYNKVHNFWAHLLSESMNIEVPEKRVNNIWRALVLQNFVLADGPRFTYGSGLVYNGSYYPFEDGFAAVTMSRYGYGTAAEAWLNYLIPASVDREKAGWRYQNRRAIPFHLLYDEYRLTGKSDYFAKNKDALFKVAEEIIADRRSTMDSTADAKPWHWGLLPPARPAVDAIASTSSNYVTAHDITNCQGLQDFGEFLIESGIDPTRGKRYLAEAADFRKSLMRAMQESVIRSPDNPPFVPLQTLYFRDTPGYGPEPFTNLALGRVQGTYYHYWADMELHYNFFNPDDQVGQWIANYLQKRGGFVLGCTRARSRPGQLYGWINDNYNAGYYEYALRRGEIERFLLGFYSRLAYDMTAHVYENSEGAPFIGYNTHDGGFVGAEYSFPNSAANAETLDMLRNMLVLEDLNDNRVTGTIDLAKGVPRAWLEDGKTIQVRDAPTFFGKLSYEIESRVNSGVISSTIEAPHRARYRNIIITFRHPHRAPIRRVRVNGKEYHDFNAKQGWVRLAAGPSQFHVEAFYR